MFSRKPENVIVKKWNIETAPGKEQEFTEESVTLDGTKAELKEAEANYVYEVEAVWESGTVKYGFTVSGEQK